jgi:FO synthase
MTTDEIVSRVEAGRRLSAAEALALADHSDLQSLMGVAAELRDKAHDDLVSYSRKVFIPLTQLCRDVCHYCTFAHAPRAGAPAYLAAEEVLEIARAGARAGCREALFTLGDKPVLRLGGARAALARLGHETTLSYLAEMAGLVLRETGLLPHLNPGVMTPADIDRLRRVSVSQGVMLESAAERLRRRGGPHFGSPDKDPAIRLETIRSAGEAAVPFTTGILIGIGETRRERIEALLALRDLHDRYGHLQEIIIQNFRAKPGTRMSQAPEPDLDDHLWTIAVTRLIFGPEMNIQAPPNLNPGALAEMVAAGINDWGGVSPVTPDHVNPERPWPALDRLAEQTAATGKLLVERLAIYPAYARAPERWLDPALRTAVLRTIDAQGFARTDDWVPGAGAEPPLVVPPHRNPLPASGAREKTAESRSPRSSGEREGPAQREGEGQLASILRPAVDGKELAEAEIVRLFAARGEAFEAVCGAADRLRQRVNGDVVSYVVTRNINYTNVCYFRCQFCAFSKGKLTENLRGRPYDLDLPEIQRRVEEAWDRGATEVCMQGGIHPEYTGATYLRICRAIKEAVPDIHIHAFSPLEIWQGAKTLGRTVPDFLRELKSAGLSSPARRPKYWTTRSGQ